MMCNFVARRLAPVVAVVLVASVPAVATTVMQMNLVEMVQRSAQIYREPYFRPPRAPSRPEEVNCRS